MPLHSDFPKPILEQQQTINYFGTILDGCHSLANFAEKESFVCL